MNNEVSNSEYEQDQDQCQDLNNEGEGSDVVGTLRQNEGLEYAGEVNSDQSHGHGVSQPLQEQIDIDEADNNAKDDGMNNCQQQQRHQQEDHPSYHQDHHNHSAHQTFLHAGSGLTNQFMHNNYQPTAAAASSSRTLPQQHRRQQSSYLPLHNQMAAPGVPLVPMVSMPSFQAVPQNQNNTATPSASASNNNDASSTAASASTAMDPINPLLQVQYYEARMRDAAAAYAQYASAAAGAALTAAQMATMPTTMQMNMNMQMNMPMNMSMTVPMQMHVPMPMHSPMGTMPGMQFGLPDPMNFYPKQNNMNVAGNQNHLNYNGSENVNNTSTSAGSPNNPKKKQQHHQQRLNDDANSNTNANAKKQKRSSFQVHQNQHSHAHSHVHAHPNPHIFQQQNRRNRRRMGEQDREPNQNAPTKNNQQGTGKKAKRSVNPRSIHANHGLQSNAQTHPRTRLARIRTRTNGNVKLGADVAVRSLDFMGKTGVSALHDLCNKRKSWSQPKFIEMDFHQSQSQPQSQSQSHAQNSQKMPNEQQRKDPQDQDQDQDQDQGYASRSSCTYSYVEFLFAVEVNGVELSRGRGGSKKSAQQDAARRALQVLFPGTVFDANGILLELGMVDHSPMVFGEERDSRDKDRGRNNKQVYCLKDLEANMASRLAIDGDGDGDGDGNDNSCSNDAGYDRYHDRPPSEDSSISTTVSMASKHQAQNRTTGGAKSLMQSQSQLPIVTGGPFVQRQERARNRLAFPSASTTSGISSASEDVDDDEYLASRGASVCSALLNVMVQIDSRIREQPSYTFDVCANPATIAQQQRQHLQGQGNGKRKGVGFSGVGGAIVSKRRSATNAVGRTVTIHRSSFACTVSLNLYTEKTKMNKHEEETNAAPVKIKLPRKEAQVSSEQVETIKVCNEITGKDDNPNQQNVEGGKIKGKKAKSPACKQRGFEQKNFPDAADDTVFERLQAVGTGATKREARHIASAKILAMLFPDCNGMVEVKKAAEAAREKYAANRAKLKRAAQSSSSDGGKGKFAKRGRRQKFQNESSMTQDNLVLIYPKPSDSPLPDWVSRRVLRYAGKTAGSEEAIVDSAPTSDDMARLSLSEPVSTSDGDNDNDSQKKEYTKKKKKNSEENAILQKSRHRQFEERVDQALQLLNDKNDERSSPSGYIKDDDLSKTLLRRATMEDIGLIERMLSKENDTKEMRSLQAEPNVFSTISPLALVGISPKLSKHMLLEKNMDISTAASQLWGSQSVVLILSRAIALPDEPPLGCAVLTIGFSLAKGRLLRISEIANEVHFPKERLIECLEEFGDKMGYAIEAGTHKNDFSNGIFFNEKCVRGIVQKYATMNEKMKQYTESSATEEDSPICNRKPLQSVKEEEGEDDEAKKDQLHHKRPKLE